MKTNVARFFSFVLALCLLAVSVPAPAHAAINTLSTTTLSAAMDSRQTYALLASITGVNGPANPLSQGAIGMPSGASYTILFVDTEAIRVSATPTSSSAPVFVERGWDGTPAQAHNSSALVYVSQPAYFARIDQYGACVAATTYVLPLINSTNGAIFNCDSSGKWVKIGQGTQNSGTVQTATNAPYTAFPTFPINSVIAPTSTTDVNGKLWYSQVFVPTSATLTGACVLVGGGTPTDNVVLALYSQTGVLLANTALAGTALANASTYQCIAFTATYNALGPQSYFVALQGNGTTAGQFYAYAAHGAPAGYITGAQTGGTFGTLLSIASPATGFTASVGPVMSLY